MDGFLKLAAGVLIALVLYITVLKQSQHIATIIGIVACVMVAAAAMNYLEPVIEFFRQLQSIANIDTEIISILLRCAGIGILTEIISFICADGGNAALGKTLQMAGSIIVLWISLPLFAKLLGLVEEMLLFV